ncbi:MAG TPA: DUF72 domain-containing protein [Polyangiaceae bacterium]|jgi:uncharacterized protein YecE (DUF72 family)
MRLRIGRHALEGDIARYAQHFDFLEVASDARNLPRLTRLAEWRAAVPEAFSFSVRLPKLVCELTSNDADVGMTLRIADALGASWLLVQTPSQVGPSPRARERLKALFARLAGPDRRIAWESRGVWEDEQAEEFAAEHGVHVVRDLLQADPPAGSLVYTRLLALGAGVQLRPSATAQLAEVLSEYDEAIVVIEGHNAQQAAKTLRQELEA